MVFLRTALQRLLDFLWGFGLSPEKNPMEILSTDRDQDNERFLRDRSPRLLFADGLEIFLYSEQVEWYPQVVLLSNLAVLLLSKASKFDLVPMEVAVGNVPERGLRSTFVWMLVLPSL